MADAIVSINGSTPGRGGRGKPLFGGNDRPVKVISGTFTFSSNYPGGGEDISEIFDAFGTDVILVLFDQPASQKAVVDYAAKKVKLLKAFAGTEQDTVDQSAVTLRWMAMGHA